MDIKTAWYFFVKRYEEAYKFWLGPLVVLVVIFGYPVWRLNEMASIAENFSAIAEGAFIVKYFMFITSAMIILAFAWNFVWEWIVEGLEEIDKALCRHE